MNGPLAPHRFCRSMSILEYKHNDLTEDSNDDVGGHPPKGEAPDFDWATMSFVTR